MLYYTAHAEEYASWRSITLIIALCVLYAGSNAHVIFSSSVTRARAEHNPFTARRTTAEATALRRRSGRSSRARGASISCAHLNHRRRLRHRRHQPPPPPPRPRHGPVAIRRRASHPCPAPTTHQAARRFSSHRRRRRRPSVPDLSQICHSIRARNHDYDRRRRCLSLPIHILYALKYRVPGRAPPPPPCCLKCLAPLPPPPPSPPLPTDSTHHYRQTDARKSESGNERWLNRQIINT